MYELHDLLDKFTEHGKKFELNQKEFSECFLEANPGEELPDYFKDEFNFPLAIASMCHEILMIKNAFEDQTES
jgi:hypothetical protein